MTDPNPLREDEVEALTAVIERELGIQEMVLAGPLTLRRLHAKRIARAAITALNQVRGESR